jgi:L-threonylcarbamoyladenylate synthase
MYFTEDNSISEVLDGLVNSIKQSGVVCLPSDSCYGFSGLAFDTSAQDKLQKIKSQPVSKSLSICLADKLDVYEFLKPSPILDIFIEEFLPGKITLIAESKKVGLLGVRVPDHLLMQQLIKQLGAPIFTTSANMHKKPACYSIEELKLQLNNNFDKIDSVVDLGVLDFSNPSTIVKISDNSLEIIREGDLAPLIKERFIIQ